MLVGVEAPGGAARGTVESRGAPVGSAASAGWSLAWGWRARDQNRPFPIEHKFPVCQCVQRETKYWLTKISNEGVRTREVRLTPDAEYLPITSPARQRGGLFRPSTYSAHLVSSSSTPFVLRLLRVDQAQPLAPAGATGGDVVQRPPECNSVPDVHACTVARSLPDFQSTERPDGTLSVRVARLSFDRFGCMYEGEMAGL
ncbi:hypothetical protein EDB89DRAFT_1907975 [Lactarius sanguifluus]|nr:hypothetical protein EDB89DRAFT_1907975 [Lactarius sanguifluus]